MKRLILAGGGNAEQSRLVDEFFASRLPRKKFLFLPQAIAPHLWSFEQAYAWIKKPRAFQDASITLCEDLDGLSAKTLSAFDAVYVMGGNTFTLLHELRAHEALPELRRFADQGGLFYGISAGAILLGKNIGTAVLGAEADENQAGLTDLSGMDMVAPFNVHCHYQAAYDSQLFDFCAKSKIPLMAIPETSGIYVDGNTATVLGPDDVFIFMGDRKRNYAEGQVFNLA